MTAEMQQVESEIREPFGVAAADCVADRVEMGHAALVRHRDLAVEHHRRNTCIDQRAKRLAE